MNRGKETKTKKKGKKEKQKSAVEKLARNIFSYLCCSCVY
jgi:hypothetical protein